ncbi:hypothetical protein ACIBG4_17330 [Nonomuraea sp. NPDC050383]|uniref:hypothetical protein n=1 Tax=Nonomuraea sp. NPDC050383 TaxID=3364362 RepID=UPI0037B00FAB
MRHVLGVVAGVLLPPLVAVALVYGVGEVSLSIQNFLVSWTGLAAIVVAGVLLALLASSRLSPVASLLGGIGFTLLGLLPFAEILSGSSVIGRFVPGWMRSGYLTLGYTGVFLVLGVLLLVASAFPSRWRSRRPPVVTPGHGTSAYEMSGHEAYGAPSHGAYGPSSYGPPSQGPSSQGPSSYGQVSDDATRPMHRE